MLRCIILLLFGLVVQAQESFPDNWQGKYKGDLLIYSTDSVRMKIEMHLEINRTANDSVFDWTLIYDPENKNDRRAYQLLLVDKDKGHYKIDEKNSIVIDAYLHNNQVLTSFFKVMDSYIMASYTKIKDDLLFEIIAAKSEPVNSSGNIKMDEQEIPEVLAYLINGRQKALLKKE